MLADSRGGEAYADLSMLCAERLRPGGGVDGITVSSMAVSGLELLAIETCHRGGGSSMARPRSRFTLIGSGVTMVCLRWKADRPTVSGGTSAVLVKRYLSIAVE